MGNIKDSIKTNLFLRIKNNEISQYYKELIPFIFPDKEDFISFLEESNYELMVKYAKKIILRLLYEAYFPPPTRLTFNLLEMEDKEFDDDFDGYQNRDHFVHIVHLYLLGIYLFNNYEPFRKPIINNFIYIRKSGSAKSDDIKKNSYKDFIIAWRYFVLYHDIGYPLEKFIGFKKDETGKFNNKAQYLKPFTNLYKSIAKDLALKGFSKLLLANEILTSPTNEKDFKHFFISHLIDQELHLENSKTNSKRTPDTLDVDYGSYTYIEKIYGFETFNLIANIIPQNKILLVLIDEELNPLMVYLPRSNMDFEAYLIVDKNSRAAATNQRLLNSNFNPFKKNWKTLKNIKIQVFISQDFKTSINDFVNILFSRKHIDYSKFIKIQDFLTSEMQLHLSAVTNEEGIKNHCFEIYSNLYEAAGYLKDDTRDSINKIHAKNAERRYKNLVKEMPNLIGKKITQLITEKYTEPEISELIDEGLSEAVETILKDISENSFQKLSSKIIDRILEDSENDYESFRYLLAAKDDLKDLLNPSKKDANKISIDEEKDKFEFSELQSNILYAKIEEKLRRNGFIAITDLMNYIPYSPENKNFVDHGVGSGLIFMDSLDIYHQFVKALDSQEENVSKVLRLSLGLDFDFAENYIQDLYNKELSEIGYTILVHNIYPEFFKSNTKVRTILEKEPFAYFSLLCDSLQPWDRKFSITQSLGKLAYATYGDRFDIILDKGKINIFEYDTNLDIVSRFKKLKIDLNKYLLNASSYIKPNLNTWK